MHVTQFSLVLLGLKINERETVRACAPTDDDPGPMAAEELGHF